MSAFLDAEDVQKLTGRKRPSAQLRWCRDNGIVAWFNGLEVVIPLSSIDGKKEAQNERSWEPDFTPIRKRA